MNLQEKVDAFVAVAKTRAEFPYSSPEVYDALWDAGADLKTEELTRAYMIGIRIQESKSLEAGSDEG